MLSYPVGDALVVDMEEAADGAHARPFKRELGRSQAQGSIVTKWFRGWREISLR